jgi:hypothetical protein
MQPAGKMSDGRNDKGGIKRCGALPRELLDDGQGKYKSGTSDMDISTDGDGSGSPAADRTSNTTLLLPPVIEATGLRATGATTDLLRKQNKHQ